MNTWKYIFTLKKRANTLISQTNSSQEKTLLLAKVDEILNKYSSSMIFPRLLRRNINTTTPLETIKNLWHYLSAEPHPEGFYLRNPTDIMTWHNDFLQIRINNLNGSIEVNGWTPKLSDNTDNDKVIESIIAQFKSQKTTTKFGLSKTITYEIDSYFKSGVIEHFNPIREYFDSLPKLGGKSEIEKVITIFNECSENAAGLFFVDWCLGLVKNALGDNYYDRILYLYSSKGGDGKTYFIQNDLIPELKDFITTDFNFNVESKDDKFKLTENLIAIDDEGTSTSRKTDDAKKSISSKTKVTERQAYARNKISLKRISSLVVCLNTDEISSASNNDRRSLIISLPSLGWNNPKSLIQRWRKEVDVNKFWSEIYSLWKTDSNFLFIDDEEILKESNNWKQANEETELIDKYIRIPQPGEKYIILSHVKIKSLISTRSGRALSRSFNGYLKTKGFENVKMKKCPTLEHFTSGYCVVVINNDDSLSDDINALLAVERQKEGDPFDDRFVDSILDRMNSGIKPTEEEINLLKKLSEKK
jgi:hypothetical protein